MKKITKTLMNIVGLVAMAVSLSTSAALIVHDSYYGNVAMSSDGFGSSSDSGTISASVEAGSTVLAAYLYTATQGSDSTPTVLLNGTAVSFGPEVTNTSILDSYLGMHRANVTSIVKSIIESGPGGIYNFSIEETVGGPYVDGSGLVIVYENSALPLASVGLLDGFSAVTGDSTSINFANPLDPTDPGFFAEMVLGIGFSCCDQASRVTINGELLTENAGNFDDGERADGALITFGSFADPFSPGLPGYEEDTERYSLVDFIDAGDTSIAVSTINPSENDNIFFAGFYVAGAAGFNEPPPVIPPVQPPVEPPPAPPVQPDPPLEPEPPLEPFVDISEPFTMSLLIAILLGMGFMRRTV